MDYSTNSPIPWITRPNEYERLVTDLIDQRFFGPVAITTSLRGARGMGKTTMARVVSRDQRVIETFPDGIYWVTLGQGLSPLELLGRLECLIFDLTGEPSGLTSTEAAEAHLNELVHPRKLLLILDEANDPELVRPFLKTGPGGGILLITCKDDSLPFGTRRTPVDIMVSEEAVALLGYGLGKEPSGGARVSPSRAPTAPLSSSQRRSAPRPEPGEVDPLLSGLVDNEPPRGGSEPSVMADAAALARLKQAENRQWAASVGLPQNVGDALSEMAGRLNEWPLLLTLVNGLLRGCLLPGDPLGCESLEDVTRVVEALLERNGLDEFWPVTDPAAREKAQDAVITACLEPLPEDTRECLFELAVFPLFEEIPLPAVSLLWEKSEADTRATCDRLAARALIFFDSARRSVQLHPIISDYITSHLRAGVLADLHMRMIKGYAARCRETPGPRNPSAWATGPDDGYFFQHLAGHLAAAGQKAELQALLFQYNWLSAHLSSSNLFSSRRGNLNALLRDYELALSTALDRQSAQLRLAQSALSLSAPVLARDPSQLATQLLGRLLSFNEPDIQALLAQSIERIEGPWLRPLSICFDPPGEEEVRVLRGHTDWVTSLALFPDGQHAVSSSLDGSLRVWDLASGQTTMSLLAHQDGVSAMVATPDGRQVVTTSWDGWLRVWDLGSGDETLRIRAHTESVGALAITPDGQRVITGADDRLIRVWDRITGEQLMELVGHGDLIRSLVVSPDGHMLVSGSWDSTVRIWDLETGRQVYFLTGHEGWVPTVAVSPDGAYALSGGWDRTLRIWDLWTGEPAGTITGFAAPVLAIAVLPDQKELLVGTGDGALHLLQFNPGAELDRGMSQETRNEPRQPAGDEQALEPARPPTPELPPHQDLLGHTGGINAIVLTREGRFAITAADDRTLRVWDLVSARVSQSPPGHKGPVFTLVNLPDGRHSLSASWDSTLKVWELANGKDVTTLAGHSGGISALAITADGRRVISGSRDRTLKVWELPSGREVFSLPGHAVTITSVSITPDGRCAVSGAEDGSLRVWDLEDQTCLAEFHGEGAIWACAIAHDGRTIVASEASGKMYFLEIRR